jgi:hypothetical protein
MATMQSIQGKREQGLPPTSEFAFSMNLPSSASTISMDTMVEEEKNEDMRVPTALPSFRLMSSVTDRMVGTVIRSTNMCESAACPCCKQQLGETIGTLNEPARQHEASSIKSLFSVSRDEDDATMQEDDDLLPGVLAAGQEYTPRRILVEGWLHKKGTGHDWLYSRAWKARWARLAMAKVQGYESEVPLLLIYWYPSSVYATTAIVLDSTVVLGVDSADKSNWNSYRFEIRHASTRENVTIPVTRTFAASQQSRDAWVYAISEALLNYEKEKARTRKSLACKPVRYDIRPSSPDRAVGPRFDEGWTGDRFVREDSRPPTPPNAGRSPQTNRPPMMRKPSGSPKRSAVHVSHGNF